ncbi:unnamed protein product [Durusdinium trenchii]|uniref:Uncharacterized protein n=1 Tax=Durusdinium trenchii TaxID=1381693 RepID=A0ABP0MKU6_9DINO
MVRVTCRGAASGELLLGPMDLDALERVEQLKRRLEEQVAKEHGGEKKKTFRLLLKEAALSPDMMLGELGEEELCFSAIANPSCVGQLQILSRERKESQVFVF